MNWPLFFLLVPTLAYLAQALWLATHGDAAMAVVFAGYTLANCGFIWPLVR